MRNVIAAEQAERASSNISRILKEYIEGVTNSRIHHFLPECIAFNQSALRHDGCHTAFHIAGPSSFFEWILVVIFCSGFPVKRQEDRACLSQLLLETSGLLSVTS